MSIKKRIGYRLRSPRPRSGVTKGSRVRIGAHVMFEGSITIGDRSAVYHYSDLVGPITIGADTFLNRSAYVRPQTTIGNRVAVGPFVRIITDSHELGPSDQRAGKSTIAPVTIGDGVWIGADVTIIGPVRIGDGAVVAAGSIVLKDVSSNTLVAGAPAKHVRDL